MANKSKELLTLPISFSKVDKVFESNKTSERFTSVLIKILHLGRNFNGSVFSKEVVENALPTLANVPILGFIEENSDNEEDFADHRMELTRDGIVYKGSCYGVIPESSVENAYFKKEVCSDGIEREYLYVKGLLFNKFEKAIDIMNKFGGEKAQSMELSENFEGHMETDGYHFTKFEFDGACILGADVQPAMLDSYITTKFEKKGEIGKLVEEKLKSFEEHFKKKEDEKDEEVGNDVEEKDKEDTKEEEKATDTTDTSKDKKADEEASNDKKDKKSKEEDDKEKKKKLNNEISEDVEFKKDEDEDKEEVKEDDEDEEEKKKRTTNEIVEEFSRRFALCHSEIEDRLYRKLFSIESLENCYCRIAKVYNDYFIYECVNSKTSQYFKQNYSIMNNEVNFNEERKELFLEFIDADTKNQLEGKTFANVLKENKELAEYKATKVEEERKVGIDEVISNFETTLDEDTLKEMKNKAYSKEIASSEDLEKELFAIVGKLNIETKKEHKKESLHYSVSLNSAEKQECPYIGLEHLFAHKN